MKRAKIRDNALKAQLRTPMFKMQRQKPKKGKGSYSRKDSFSSKDSYLRKGREHRQAA